MKRLVLLIFLTTTLAVGFSGCGKKSDPVLKDTNGKVVKGHSFPPPYDAQIPE